MKTLDDRKKEAALVNLKLVGKWAGVLVKTEYECPIHGVILQTPNKVQQGLGCQKCGRQSQFSKRRAVIDNVKSNALKVGLEYVSGYVNANKRAVYKCPVHGNITMFPSSIYRGATCKKCSAKKGAEKNKLTENQVKLAAEKVGLEMTGEYKGLRVATTFKCPIHGETKKQPIGVVYGRGCQMCAKYGFNPSKPAYFYIYSVVGIDSKFAGFGITANFKSRNRNHILSFKENGLEFLLTFLIRFESGEDARQLENLVKNQFSQYLEYPKVNGFKTEAVNHSMIDEIKIFASSYLANIK